MIKTIRDTLFWLLFAVLLVMMIDGAFGAPAPGVAAPEEDEVTFVIIAAEQWNHVAASLNHWYAEAQRLAAAKGRN